MSLDSENCYCICTISSENAREESFSHEDLCLSKQSHSLFILYCACFMPWFMPKSQIHSAHCINKIIIATPRTHSCTNMIQSSYKLQIPQEPPWKTDLWCIHAIHYLLARKNNCWHMEKCRLASKSLCWVYKTLFPNTHCMFLFAGNSSCWKYREIRVAPSPLSESGD